MDIYSHQPLTAADADAMRAHLERVQREERDWLEYQLHRDLHGFLSRDECPTCILDESIARANADLERDAA